VIRRAAALLVLTAAATAAPLVVAFADGREVEGAKLIEATTSEARLVTPEGETTVPATSLASVSTPAAASDVAGTTFNLYLANGDRLRGTVRGAEGKIALDSGAVEGFSVALDDVRAVRFGRLLGQMQAEYERVFARQLERPRDVVVVQQDAKPFLVLARVLDVNEKTLRVRIAGGSAERELAAHKVYGFVRTGDAPLARGALRVRLFLRDEGRVTLPLERIDATTVVSGPTRVKREELIRIDFAGDHIAHLSGFDPVTAKEVALFGTAPHLRRDEMVLGGPLRCGGRTYRRGIGVHAYSRLEYALGGRWRSVFLLCGIDDAAGPEGSATFRILGDGKLLKEVERHHGQPPSPVTLDVAGVDRLVLEAVPGETYTSDFCDWIEARVFNAGQQK